MPYRKHNRNWIQCEAVLRKLHMTSHIWRQKVATKAVINADKVLSEHQLLGLF